MSSKQKQYTDTQISTIIEKSEDNDVEQARITGARLTLVMVTLTPDIVSLIALI